jgi:hypothetical protein
MSRLQSPMRRVEALRKQLMPSPTIINCTGAKDELLAKLKYDMLADGMTEKEIDAPIESTPEQEAFMHELCAYLDNSIKRIERDFNVRFVSYE